MPVNRWVDKKAVVHLCNAILLSNKKEGNLAFWDSMDKSRGYYAKWNKTDREINTIWFNGQNKQTK